jgi:hypothetical protein
VENFKTENKLNEDIFVGEKDINVVFSSQGTKNKESLFNKMIKRLCKINKYFTY